MTNKDNRLSRETESREFTERKKQWVNPELLPEPDKQAGYSYRWVRVAMNGQADPRNLSSKLREGFEPVKIEEQPKFKLLIDPDSRFKDNIEIGGLLLCKVPEEFVQARFEHEQKVTQANADAVDNSFMRQSDSRMPLFRDRQSSVSYGKK